MEENANRPALFGWWGVVLVWLAWGLVNVLRLGAMPDFSWTQALSYGLPDALLWVVVTPLLVAVSRRFEIHGEPWRRHLGVLALTSAFVVLGHTAVDSGLAGAAAGLQGGFEAGLATWWSVFINVLRYEFHTRLLICTLVIGFAHYQIYARRLAEQQSRASHLAAQLTAAKLTHLRRQLRPHFLFNALNSVSASMAESPQRGRLVVRRLGELLRASLRGEQEQWLSLEKELDLVRAYLEIEQVRFEDRIEIRIDAEPTALACAVPALILQPIVENAVCHGIASRIEGGTIAVRAHLDGPRLLLEVEDNGSGVPVGAELSQAAAEGIGLANIRQRLEVLYGSDASLHFAAGVAGALVRISLPRRQREAA